MWLAVDSGNTRLKWALMDGTRIVSQAAMAKQKPHLPSARQIDAVWISHVGSQADLARLKKNLYGMRRIHFIKSRRAAAGVYNRYRPAAALGSDRWLCLLAARQQQGSRPVLVVSAGTAITIDILLPTGEFSGGIILPGLALMPAALSRSTPLPSVTAPVKPASVQPPVTTYDAIVTGTAFAAAGAVRLARRRFAPGARVLLTGGDAARLLPYITQARLVPDLLFRGIACLRNA